MWMGERGRWRIEGEGRVDGKESVDKFGFLGFFGFLGKMGEGGLRVGFTRGDNEGWIGGERMGENVWERMVRGCWGL